MFACVKGENDQRIVYNVTITKNAIKYMSVYTAAMSGEIECPSDIKSCETFFLT